MDINKRLSEIQRTLKAPKGQYNSFGKYHYRSCEDILNAVKELLQEDETILLSDEIVNHGDRYYIKALAIFAKEKDTVSVEGWARESETKKGMDDSQITGSTSSYARKYALNGLFAIDDTKDADTTNKHGKDKEKKQSTEQKEYSTAPCKFCGEKKIYKTGDEQPSPQFKCDNCNAAGWINGDKVSWKESK